MDGYAKITLNGKDYGLYYCVGAAKDLAELCGGNLTKADEMFTGNTDKILVNVEKVILLLNKWYCKMAAYEGVTAIPVTEEAIDLFLDLNDIGSYVSAISDAIQRGTKQTVEVQPVPVKNAESGLSQ